MMRLFPQYELIFEQTKGVFENTSVLGGFKFQTDNRRPAQTELRLGLR